MDANHPRSGVLIPCDFTPRRSPHPPWRRRTPLHPMTAKAHPHRTRQAQIDDESTQSHGESLGFAKRRHEALDVGRKIDPASGDALTPPAEQSLQVLESDNIYSKSIYMSV